MRTRGEESAPPQAAQWDDREVVMGMFFQIGRRILGAALLLGYALAGEAGVGRTPGFPAVTPGGESGYSIPIVVPAGTHGLTPTLSLEYRHRSRGGAAGIGWTIGGLSSIERCPRTIAQDGGAGPIRYLQADRFCLDGQRLVVSNGRAYGTPGAEYRGEIERYARIRSYGTAGTGPQYFILEAADGRILEFGATTDSRIEAGLAATVRIWALNRIRDRSGNVIDFHYTEDTTRGSYRLASVDYNSNPQAGVPSSHQVVFLYEARPESDADFMSEAGAAVSTAVRLDRIDVRHTGAVLRRYELSYEASLSASGRSRLASVQECGAGGADCLGSTVLGWQDGTPGLGAELRIPLTPGGSAQMSEQSRWWSGDINGDGRDDLCWAGGTVQAPTLRYRLALAEGGFGPEIDTGIASPSGAGTPLDYNGDGFADALLRSPGSRWQVVQGGPQGFGAVIDQGSAASVLDYRAADLDGNGLSDLAYSVVEGGSGNGLVVRVRYNQPGAGFTSAPVTLYEQASAAGYERPEGGDFLGLPGQRIDLDGDGREDLLLNERYSIARISADQAVSEYFDSAFRGGAPADVNGDGCTDFVYPHYTGRWRARVSSCQLSPGIVREIAGPSSTGLQYGVAAFDWDGDGKQDLLYRDASASWRVVRSTGSSLLPAQDTGITHGDPQGLRVADLDGDGLDDLVTWLGSELRYRRHAGPMPDLLLTARDGLGAEVGFAYAPLTRPGVHAKGAGSTYPDRDLQDGRQVVTAMVMNDGAGLDAKVTLAYTYAGLRANSHGRGDLGFAERHVTEQGIPDALVRKEGYRQDYPYTGLPDGETLARANGMPLWQVSREWSSLSLAAGEAARSVPYLARSTAHHYASGGWDRVEHTRIEMRVVAVDPASGVVTDRIVTTTEMATGINTGASRTERIRHPSLLNDTAHWCLGRPQASEVSVGHTLAGGDGLTRRAAWTWDAAGCRPRQQRIEPGITALHVTTDLGYDRFGNVVSRVVTGADMPSRRQSVSWDARGWRPLRVTNSLGQATRFAWDAASGVLTAMTDPNGLATSWSHDGFWRPVLETRADGTRTLLARSACATSCDARTRYQLQQQELDSAGKPVRSVLLEVDRFERPFKVLSQLPGGGYSVTETDFDARGRPARVSLPRWSTVTAPGYWRYEFDVLGRMTAAALHSAGGAIERGYEVAYEGLRLRATDPRGHVSTRLFSAWGDLARVTDALGGDTHYRYDAFGHLVEVRDALNNVVSALSYDARGMKRAQQDADLGLWTFTHNALGELVSQTDAKGRTTTYVYDALGRPVRRNEPEGVTTWTWGTSASARNVGRLVALSGPGYSENHGYDSLGRLATRTIRSDATYQYAYGYNAFGQLDTLTYPASTAGFRLRLNYDYDHGHLSRISPAGVPGPAFWQLGAVDASGRVLDETLGQALRVVTGFSPLTGELEYRRAWLGSGGSIQDLAYEWDDSGNLAARRDLKLGITEQFQHDALDRLEHTRRNGAPDLGLRYDAIGNITWKSDICAGSSPCYTYEAGRRHAVKTAGSRRYAYDANGNMTVRDGATIGWYGSGLPAMISRPGGDYSSFWYAPDRSRWKQVARQAGVLETSIYAGGSLEKVTRSGVTTWRHYVHAPGGIAAVYLRDSASSAPRIHYLTRDHLGSVDKVVAADGAGVAVAESFDAFGRRRGADWTGNPSSADLAAIAATTRRGFGGHEHLDNLGLVHMNGRVYDPVIGRFLSPDPYVHEPYNAQDLNRYSYAWNSPLRVIDPSGLQEVDCLRSVDGACQSVTVFGARDPGGLNLQGMVGRSGQLASASERDPCGQDGSMAACNFRGPVTAVVADPVDTASPWSQLGSASLNSIPGWYYSGQAAAAMGSGDYLTAVLFYGATVGDVFLLGRGGSAALASRFARTELHVARAVRHGPVRPGPLAEQIAATFRSGSYTATMLEAPLTVYRVIGPSGNPTGRFWTTEQPRGALQSVIDLAIDQNWRNPATRVIRAEIPAGTVIYEGAAAPQRGLVGGATQIYIPQVDPGWLR